MPRFVTQRDYEFIQHITREMIDETMDVGVVLYKIVLDSVKINLYGESVSKPRYTPVKVNAVVNYNKNIVTSGDGFGLEQQQRVDFRFARRMLQEVNVYPEIGDIIGYNNHYYEINNMTETQLIAGKPGFNTAIICASHLTRRTSIDIEEAQV
jgi:transcriptional regulator with PAS, ATPase and Fis domain